MSERMSDSSKPRFYTVYSMKYGHAVQNVTKCEDADLNWEGGAILIPRFLDDNDEGVRARLHDELHDSRRRTIESYLK
jgi:hypothetical protein